MKFRKLFHGKITFLKTLWVRCDFSNSLTFKKLCLLSCHFGCLNKSLWKIIYILSGQTFFQKLNILECITSKSANGKNIKSRRTAHYLHLSHPSMRPPTPECLPPNLPPSLHLSFPHSVSPSRMVDVRLINGANCFMAGLAWCWQCNQAEWGGLGEAITLPIVRKDRRTRPGQCTQEGLGHGERPSSTVTHTPPPK